MKEAATAGPGRELGGSEGNAAHECDNGGRKARRDQCVFER